MLAKRIPCLPTECFDAQTPTVDDGLTPNSASGWGAGALLGQPGRVLWVALGQH